MAKAPRYALEAYLTQLRGEKDQAWKALGAAQTKLTAEEEKKAALEAEHTELEARHRQYMADYWDGLRQGALSGAQIESRRLHLEGIASDTRDKKREILAQERAIVRATQAVEQAKTVYVGFANELEIHEEKKAEWKRGLAREESRKEQRALEDIALARHIRRQRGGS